MLRVSCRRHASANATVASSLTPATANTAAFPTWPLLEDDGVENGEEVDIIPSNDPCRVSFPTTENELSGTPATLGEGCKGAFPRKVDRSGVQIGKVSGCYSCTYRNNLGPGILLVIVGTEARPRFLQ